MVDNKMNVFQIDCNKSNSNNISKDNNAFTINKENKKDDQKLVSNIMNVSNSDVVTNPQLSVLCIFYTREHLLI